VSGKRKEQAQKRKLQLEKVGELVEKAKAEGLTLNKLRNLLHEVHQRETSLRDDRETISNTLEELARIRIVTTIDVLLQELFKKKLDVLILDIVKGQLLSSKETRELEKRGKPEDFVVRENPVYAGAQPAQLRPAEPLGVGTFKLKTVGY